MTQRRIMLASMMDEEDGKAVDSDGSTEGEEDFRFRGYTEEKKEEVGAEIAKFKIPKLFPKV